MTRFRALLLPLVAAFVLTFVPVEIVAQSGCDGGDYSTALCNYRRGDYQAAEALFAAIVERGAEEPETIKAHYFLARSRMKLKKWEEAAKDLMGIYSLSSSFYREWNCDFLLGQCRRAMGRG